MRELLDTWDSSEAQECSLRWGCAATLRYLTQLEDGLEQEDRAYQMLEANIDLALCLLRLQVLNNINDQYCDLLVPEEVREPYRGYVD